MISGILYHTASGMIVSLQKGDLASLQAGVPQGYSMLGLDDGHAPVDYANTYVNSLGAITTRVPATPTTSAALVAPGETVTISNLPTGSWVRDNNALVQVIGTSYQVTSATAGWRVIELAGKYKADPFQIEFSELVQAQTDAKNKIDTDAEAARSRVVTPGSGQAMTYLRKADAAVAFLAGQSLTAAQSKRISDEASRLGVTNEQAAQSLVDTANQWEQLDSIIDNTRLVTKKSIDAVTSPHQIEAILAAVTWPV